MDFKTFDQRANKTKTERQWLENGGKACVLFKLKSHIVHNI